MKKSNKTPQIGMSLWELRATFTPAGQRRIEANATSHSSRDLRRAYLAAYCFGCP